MALDNLPVPADDDYMAQLAALAAATPPDVTAPPADAPPTPAQAPVQQATAPVPTAQSTAMFPDGFYEAYKQFVQQKENAAGDPNAKNPDPNSTAAGLWQINDPTMAGLNKNYPDAHFTGKNDENALKALSSENYAALKKAGIDNPTIEQLYSAHHLGAPTAVAALRGQGAVPTSGGTSDAAAPPAGAGDVQNSATPSRTDPYAFLQSLYKQGNDQLNNQKTSIDAYIASQPQMFAKLQDTLKAYGEAAKPTLGDTVSDAFNQWASLKNAANANRLASTGGILTGQLPDPTSFNQGIAQAHQSDVQARQARIDAAKTQLNASNQLTLAELQQGGTNVGLQNSLADSIVKYGLETGKLTTQTIQMGNENAGKLQEAVKGIIPNVDTLNNPVVAKAIIDATKDSPLDLNGNIQRVRAIGAAAASGTLPGLTGPLQILAKTPAEPTNMAPPPGFKDEQGRTGVVHTVDTSTTAGKAEFDDLKSKGWTFSPPVPTTTNNVGTGTGDVASETQKSALTSLNTAQDVAHHIDFLKELAKTISTTGVLTDNPMSLAVQNAVKQLTGRDPGNISAREFFDKELKSFANQETFKQFAAGSGGSRIGQQEFKIIGQGLVTPQMPIDTIIAALTKYQYDALREVQRSTTIGTNAFNAQRDKLPFNPIQESADFEKANPYRPPAIPDAWLNGGAAASRTIIDRGVDASGKKVVKYSDGNIEHGE